MFKKKSHYLLGPRGCLGTMDFLLRNIQLGVEANGKSHGFFKALPRYHQCLLLGWRPKQAWGCYDDAPYGTFREPEEGRQNLCLIGNCYGLRLVPFQALQLKPQRLLRWSWEEVASECGILWLEQGLCRRGQENITFFSPLLVATRKRWLYQPLWVCLPHTASPTMCSYKVNTALSTPMSVFTTHWIFLHLDLGFLTSRTGNNCLLSNSLPCSIAICYGASTKTKTVVATALPKVSVNHLLWHITVLQSIL